MSWITLKSRKMRHIVSGTPKVIIKDGILDQKVLKNLRYSVDDLMTALRSNNIFDISQVQYAVVETNGSVSVYEKYPYRNITNMDMNIKGRTSDPPVIIIADGKIVPQGLADAGLKRQWATDILERKHLRESDVFLLIADKSGDYTLIKRRDTDGKS